MRPLSDRYTVDGVNVCQEASSQGGVADQSIENMCGVWHANRRPDVPKEAFVEAKRWRPQKVWRIRRQRSSAHRFVSLADLSS